MATTKRGSGKSIAEASSEAAQTVMREHKQSLRAPGVKIVMPGGKVQDATPYLSSRFKVANHTSELCITRENAHEHFNDEWLADHPGFHYGFIEIVALASDVGKHPQASQAMSLLNQGMYIPVPKSALREGVRRFYMTHKTAMGDELLQIRDVALVAISPDAWEELYKSKEAMAVSAIAGNVEKFYADVANTDPGPGATGTVADFESKLDWAR